MDLLLLDGAKTLYGNVLNLMEKHLRPGALVVADNTDYCPQYLAYVRAPENGYLSVPFADLSPLTGDQRLNRSTNAYWVDAVLVSSLLRSVD